MVGGAGSEGGLWVGGWVVVLCWVVWWKGNGWRG